MRKGYMLGKQVAKCFCATGRLLLCYPVTENTINEACHEPQYWLSHFSIYQQLNISITIQHITLFSFLFQYISSSLYCGTEIWRRIALSKQAFMNKKKLFLGNLSIELKKRTVKSVLWSVVLYASETWSMTQADRKRLEAMEMWVWTRMEKISWVDKISSEEVLQRVNERHSGKTQTCG